MFVESSTRKKDISKECSALLSSSLCEHFCTYLFYITSISSQSSQWHQCLTCTCNWLGSNPFPYKKKKKKKLHQKQQQQSKKEQQRILHLYKWRWISWRFRVTHKCHTVTKHTQNHMTIDYTGCTRGSPEAQQVSTAPTATPIPKRLIECLYRSSCATTYPSSWNASRGLKSYSRTEPDSCLA